MKHTPNMDGVGFITQSLLKKNFLIESQFIVAISNGINLL